MKRSAVRQGVLTLLLVHAGPALAWPGQGSLAGPPRSGQPMPPPPSQASLARAAEILAATRKALGGDTPTAVDSVVATGRTRRLRGNNIQPVEFEISMALPNKYVRPAAGATPAQKDQYANELRALRARTQATPVQYRLYFADYRDVDGHKLPFRLRRAVGNDTTEETTFDGFRLNTRIDPKTFETGEVAP